VAFVQPRKTSRWTLTVSSAASKRPRWLAAYQTGYRIAMIHWRWRVVDCRPAEVAGVGYQQGRRLIW
jgi:hypothetical protein